MKTLAVLFVSFLVVGCCPAQSKFPKFEQTQRFPKPAFTGYADLHAHMFANLGFGNSGILWGEPNGPVDRALGRCDSAHGLYGARDAFANLGLQEKFGHSNYGNPKFCGWPRWDSYTHQMMYRDWLRRAVDGGLRLIVVLAVNSEEACRVFRPRLAPHRTCNDAEAIRYEIAAAKEMARNLDEQLGAVNNWFRVVTTPADARAVIRDGKLAVVLGAEVDYPLNCLNPKNTSCSQADIVSGIKSLKDSGISYVFPIHLETNGNGGEAIYNIATGGSYRDCAGEGYEFAQVLSPLGATCNRVGLTSTGVSFVRELMRQHMIVDINHMSVLAADRTLDLAEESAYPVVAGHTGFLTISRYDRRNEGSLTDTQVQRIAKLGGMVAPILNQGSLDETVTWHAHSGTIVQHVCGQTSQTWLQAYLFAVDHMSPPRVALGSDFNGFAGLPGPRFGRESCPGGEAPERVARSETGVSYPFDVDVGAGMRLPRSQLGDRTFDYNVDGLAHVGMLPDFIEDLRRQGLTDADIAPLLRSAEDFVDVWERAEQATVR